MTDRIHEGTIRDEIARSSGDSKTLLRNFSRELFAAIRQGLLDDGHVRLHQFGSFKLKWARQRKGRNPRTGEELIIPAQPRIVFTAAKALKDQANKNLLTGAAIAEPKTNKVISDNIASPPVAIATDMPLKENASIKIRPTEQKTIIREPYLSKNINQQHKDVPPEDKLLPKSLAATLIIAALAFYSYQPSTDTDQAIVAGSPPDNSITASEIKSADIEARSEPKQLIAETEIDVDTTETITLEPAVLEYANEPEQIAGIEPSAIENNAEPAATTHTPAAFFTEKSHHLVNGDSLWRLSKKNYINPFYWPHIYQANNKNIYNPNKLLIGRTITLPTLYGHPEKLTDVDRRHIAEGYFLVYRYNKKHKHPFSYYALLGVKKFDPSVIEDHIYEITENDWENLQLASN